jgi:hypothetical protein
LLVKPINSFDEYKQKVIFFLSNQQDYKIGIIVNSWSEEYDCKESFKN